VKKKKKKKKKKKETHDMTAETDPIARLRRAVRFYYDVQKLRMGAGSRGREDEAIQLAPEDQAFFRRGTADLKDLEREAEKHIASRIKGIPIYEEWLKHQYGCAAVTSGVIISLIDIERAQYPSSLWAFAGLDVMPDGRGRRLVRGQKASYNPMLKSKLMGVLAENFVKQYTWSAEMQAYVRTSGKLKDEEGNVVLGPDGEPRMRIARIWRRPTPGQGPTSPDPDTGDPYPWRQLYDRQKHRRLTQIGRCRPCNGTGRVDPKAKAEQGEGDASSTVCWNCGGDGVGPWGYSNAHRDLDAKRKMIKVFLLELYKSWRALEGLPVAPSYHEAKHGHVHSRDDRPRAPQK